MAVFSALRRPSLSKRRALGQARRDEVNLVFLPVTLRQLKLIASALVPVVTSLRIGGILQHAAALPSVVGGFLFEDDHRLSLVPLGGFEFAMVLKNAHQHVPSAAPVELLLADKALDQKVEILCGLVIALR